MLVAHHLVDQASDAAFAIDGKQRILSWNDRAERLLDYRRREVIGEDCAEVLRAVTLDGKPVCAPNCDGLRCFVRFQPFEAKSCLAVHRDGHKIALDIASMVMPREASDGDQMTGVAVIFLRGQEEDGQQALADTRLQIFAFGAFGLTIGGRSLEVESWGRKQALTLLKLLLVNLGRAIPREVLIDKLWPDVDEKTGWGRLKVTVYYLRRQLRAAGINETVVETKGRAYTLRHEAVCVDARIYEDFIAAGDACRKRQHWEGALDHFSQALRLYRGHYMSEDFHADWCSEERERLREIHLEMLTDMAECYVELSQHREAVAVCRGILVEDPCRENIHRALMENLIYLGRTGSARAQYFRCCEILASELSVEPMPETKEL